METRIELQRCYSVRVDDESLGQRLTDALAVRVGTGTLDRRFDDLDGGAAQDLAEAATGREPALLQQRVQLGLGRCWVRRVLERHRLHLEDEIPELGGPLGEELLKPTRIYVETVLNLLRDFPLSGICHVTGGGLTDNVPRILPKSCQAVIERQSWPVPPIFHLLRDKGDISEGEMLRTFNNGIGLVVVVAGEYVADVLLRLQGLNEQGYVIGEIVERKNDDPSLVYI